MTSDAFLTNPARACNPDDVDTADRGAWTSDHLPGKVRAKRFCRECPVKTACLTYALNRNERFGIWGGVDMANTRHRTAARHGRKTTSDQVLDLWQQHLPNGAIATQVGIHTDTVSDHLARLGLRAHGRPGPKAREQVAA